jgi:hypothetical protein
MKRSRFTEEQIIGILKEQEAGARTVDVCRYHRITPSELAMKMVMEKRAA